MGLSPPTSPPTHHSTHHHHHHHTNTPHQRYRAPSCLTLHPRRLPLPLFAAVFLVFQAASISDSRIPAPGVVVIAWRVRVGVFVCAGACVCEADCFASACFCEFLFAHACMPFSVRMVDSLHPVVHSSARFRFFVCSVGMLVCTLVSFPSAGVLPSPVVFTPAGVSFFPRTL
jgi:hypothetical protein